MKQLAGYCAVILTSAGLAACSAGPPSGAKAAAGPDEMVCRQITPTGTTLRVKDCRTAAEWAAFEARAKAGVEDTMRTRGTPGAS
jgi:hypothetical protein